MKKFTAILLTVIMVASLFTSCSNSIAPNIDETVSVSFDEATSRSLTASLENFVKGDYFWKYAAQKNASDGTGLNSGATEAYDEAHAKWVKGDTSSESNKGLGSVAGFSQGIWDFKLFAYKKVGTAEKLAYEGEVTGVSLKKGSANTVTVTVSPVAGATGTLILADTISLAPAKAGNTPTNLAKVYTVTELGGTAAISPTTGTNQWTLDAGAYKVNVDFVKDGFTYASGSVVATVYSNITTTVSGSLAELVTKAEFDSSINPDVMNKEASSDSVDLGTLTQTGASVVTLKDAETEAGSKVIAKVPAAAASQIINTVAGSQASANTTIDLALRVDTVSATNTTLELEIGMQATVTQKDVTDKVINQTTQKVTELKNIEGTPVISVVTIKLQPGLQNVAVKHNGTDMVELSVSNNGQGYSYDANTGILTIKTSSFSPFTVTYDEPAYVAKVGDVSYRSLQGAVDAAENKATIVLLKDVFLNKTVTINKSVNVNLNGYTITGNGVRALHFTSGESEIAGAGSIKVIGGSNISAGSSVIRVGDGSDWSNPETGAVKLTIGENVTVETDACYAISIFGSKTQEEVVVRGKLLGLAGLGTSGNEKHSEYAPVIKLESTAKIKASEGYALYLPAAGSYEINGTIEGPGAICTKAGNLTIAIGDGAIITATGEAGMKHEGGFGNGPATKNYAVMVENNNSYGGPANVVINGGIINGSLGVYDDEKYPPTDAQKGTITITGGTFSSDPTEFLGGNCIASNEEGKYVVFTLDSKKRSLTDDEMNSIDSVNIFKRGQNAYVLTSGKYTLGNINADLMIFIPEENNVELDLAGNTIDSTFSGFSIANCGVLTVNDSSEEKKGKVYNSSKNVGDDSLLSGSNFYGHDAIRNFGNLTINGGIFGDFDTDQNNDNDTTYGASIRNQASGEVTINSGRFTCGDNYGEYSSGDPFYSYALRNYGTMTINDGTVYGKMNGGVSADGGTITVNGGSIVIENPTSWHTFTISVSGTTPLGKITITGGRFVNNNTTNGHLLSGFNGKPSWGVTENLESAGYFISGGTFIEDNQEKVFGSESATQE